MESNLVVSQSEGLNIPTPTSSSANIVPIPESTSNILAESSTVDSLTSEISAAIPPGGGGDNPQQVDLPENRKNVIPWKPKWFKVFKRMELSDVEGRTSKTKKFIKSVKKGLKKRVAFKKSKEKNKDLPPYPTPPYPVPPYTISDPQPIGEGGFLNSQILWHQVERLEMQINHQLSLMGQSPMRRRSPSFSTPSSQRATPARTLTGSSPRSRAGVSASRRNSDIASTSSSFFGNPSSLRAPDRESERDVSAYAHRHFETSTPLELLEELWSNIKELTDGRDLISMGSELVQKIMKLDSSILMELIHDCQVDSRSIKKFGNELGFELVPENADAENPVYYKPVNFTDEQIKVQKDAKASAQVREYDCLFLSEDIGTKPKTKTRFLKMLKRAHNRTYNKNYDYYPERNEYRDQSERKNQHLGKFENKPLPENFPKFPLYLENSSYYEDNIRMVEIFRLKPKKTKTKIFQSPKTPQSQQVLSPEESPQSQQVLSPEKSPQSQQGKEPPNPTGLKQILAPVKEACIEYLKEFGETEETREIVQLLQQNILQFMLRPSKEIEIDHFFNTSWRAGLTSIMLNFDNDSFIKYGKSAITSGEANQVRGRQSNRDLPENQRYAKLLGLKNYLFIFFEYTLRDDNWLLNEQLEMRKWHFSPIDSAFRKETQKVCDALEITQKDWSELKKSITISPEKVDFTNDQLIKKHAELLESALVEASELADNFLNNFTGNNKEFTIPIEMEYLLAYLHMKSGIILYLFNNKRSSLLHNIDFSDVKEKLTLFFQEINSFQYVLEKKTNVNFHELIEKNLKSKFIDGLLKVTDFKNKNNLVWEEFGTADNFKKWLLKTSNTKDKLIDDSTISNMIVSLVNTSENYPITDKKPNTLLGKNYYKDKKDSQKKSKSRTQTPTS